MKTSIAAPHAKGKFAKDVIFGVSDAAQAAAKRLGVDKVVNATVGAIFDENSKLAFLPTVEKVFRSMPSAEIVAYAPIRGLADYANGVKQACFGDYCPDTKVSVIATAGGTGAIALAIWNYTSEGDTILTSDWYWGAYKTLCEDKKRKLSTYSMVTEDMKFNLSSLSDKFDEILKTQDSLFWLINSPAHNPTGYSLTNDEWNDCLELVKKHANNGKNIIVFVDVAYLDFAGDKDKSRTFFKKFSNLPDNVLVLVAYSMSKGFTLYGQRTGALIALSDNADIIEEFDNINEYTCRSTWSNINRAAMRTLATIYQDPKLISDIEKEREEYCQMIKARADIFTAEAKECGLVTIPYVAGFFISIPVKNSSAVCDELMKDNIFAVPLTKGVRLAVCSMPLPKVKGLAAIIKAAIDKVDNN